MENVIGNNVLYYTILAFILLLWIFSFPFLKRKTNLKRDVNDFGIKYAIREYFEFNEISALQMQLHLIEVKTTKDVINVNITLGRPGFLIGKGGETLDGLKERLKLLNDMPVEINLIEYDVFGMQV